MNTFCPGHEMWSLIWCSILPALLYELIFFVDPNCVCEGKDFCVTAKMKKYVGIKEPQKIKVHISEKYLCLLRSQTVSENKKGECVSLFVDPVLSSSFSCLSHPTSYLQVWWKDCLGDIKVSTCLTTRKAGSSSQQLISCMLKLYDQEFPV